MSFKIPVHELIKRPGLMRELELDIDLENRIGTEVVGVPRGSVLELDLRLESVYEGILASGEVYAIAASQCSRCLDDLKFELDVEFQELFYYRTDNEEDLVVEAEQIDIEQQVIDAIVLELPFQPVCSADCLGLCVECGFRLSDDPEHHHEAPIDSRFGALKDLLEKPKD